MAIRKRWAFLVGINRYTDFGTLNYCVDDVLALEELLTAADYTVVCLHDRLDRDDRDGNPNPRFPTEKNIRAELNTLCNIIRQGPDQGQNNLLLVYFACHGSREPDGVPRLVARDTRQSQMSDAIAVTEVEALMTQSGAGCRMLMLDACRIGLGTSDVTSRAPSDPELLQRIHDMARGYALLAASTDQQDAREWSGVKHGLFSYYVLSGLSGKADLHGKNYVTVTDLAGFVSLKIQEWAVDHNISQVPCQRIENNLGGFPLISETGLRALTSVQTANLQPPDNNQTLILQGRGNSYSSVVDYLWALNCDEQCHSFKASTPRSQRVAAFVVQAKDSRIQQWLVKRLFRQLPNVANARVFPVVVPTHPMWRKRNFSEFWTDLAKELRCSANRDSVIEALIEIYQTKPIIIAMYGWSAASRSQKLRQQVLNDFWQPVVSAIGALPKQPTRSRLILFLAEGSDTVADSPAKPPTAMTAAPIPLAPLLEITCDHLETWGIDNDLVCAALGEIVSQDAPSSDIDALVEEQIAEIAECGPDPVKTIEQICFVFGLENGIADIEPYWRLAG